MISNDYIQYNDDIIIKIENYLTTLLKLIINPWISNALVTYYVIVKGCSYNEGIIV